MTKFSPPSDRDLEQHTPLSGYALWSETYDSMMTDTVDGPILKHFLAGGIPDYEISLLDYGCGTGRTVEWLRNAGYSIRAAGVDISIEMMGKARVKGIYESVVLPGDLPENTEYDMAISVLTSCHMEDLSSLYSYVSSRLKPGGIFILIDMHPHMFEIGKGTFVPFEGKKIYIENYVHSIADHTAAGKEYSLKLLDQQESFVPEGWAKGSDEYHPLTGQPLGIGFKWEKSKL